MKKNVFTFGEGVPVDLSMLIDTRLLIQANSGGGKSYCVRRLLEQTHGKVQHLVIDPEGEYASLRERYDYVLASKDGDTPADPRSAKLLAERLLELKASAILDIYELKHHARIEFVKNFLDTIVNAPKHLWHPVLVVIDEAHVFCPQQGEAESASAVSDICTRGRKRGFCAVLATQRLSKLHKDAAAECNNKLVGRSSLDVDMKRAADELGFARKDQMYELRTLEPGEFFAYGPALSREVRRIRIGEIRTTHPKAGGRKSFKAPPPTRHIRALLPRLADLPAESDQRERNETELRHALADVRRQLTQARKVQPTPEAKVIEKIVPALTGKQLTRLDRLVDKMTTFGSLFAMNAQTFATAITEIKTAVLSVRMGQPPHQAPLGRTIHPVQPSATKTPPALATAPAIASNGGPERLPPGERKMLVAVAQMEDGVTREQLSVLTHYQKSTRNVYLSRLVVYGYVTIQGGRINATSAGLAALGAFERLPSGEALRDHWLRRLPPGEGKILEIAIAMHPTPLTRQEIEARTVFKKSTRNVYLGRLVSRKLLTPGAAGEFVVSQSLFG